MPKIKSILSKIATCIGAFFVFIVLSFSSISMAYGLNPIDGLDCAIEEINTSYAKDQPLITTRCAALDAL